MYKYWISNHVPRTGHDQSIKPLFLVCCHFKPRAPYGARLEQSEERGNHVCISNHVPRTGHDSATPLPYFLTVRFQTTCPVRGTT